jgi:hypothetical protein
MSPIPLIVMFAALHAAGNARPIDACALLTTADLESVLGETIKDRKPGTQPAGPLLTSQCLIETSAKSVSVTVTRTNPAAPTDLTAREYWKRQFHAAEHNGEDDRRARPIAGIGDEAYWTGNRFAGALYVLRGGAFLRLSVGGIRDEKTRIDVSQRLAREALARLDQLSVRSQVRVQRVQQVLLVPVHVLLHRSLARPWCIEVERHPSVVLTFA